MVLAVQAHAEAQPAPPRAPAGSQGAETTNFQEIVVTARRRDETLQNVPVVVQAISGVELQNLNIRDMYQLSSVTPGLSINAGAGIVGAQVYLRGLGSGQAAVYIDQSVLFNIDGISLNHGTALRTSLFDIAQVEVMKGPQALFFGKSASAGIVAVKSADPTPYFESKLSAAYGFGPDQKDVDGYVSGPLTSKISARLAAFYSTSPGYLENDNPAAAHRNAPHSESYGGRLTFKYDDQSRLRARLKLLYSEVNAATNALASQRVCQAGPGFGNAAQQPFGFYDDCRLNHSNTGRPDTQPPYRPGLNYSFGSADFAIGSPNALTRDGNVYEDTEFGSVGFNVDYDITPQLTLSSITGYAHTVVEEAYVTGSSGTAVLRIGDRSDRDNFSQELRLTSDYNEGWFNYMVGGYYAKESFGSEIYLISPPGTYINNFADYRSETYSFFAQLLFTPIEHFELSVGGRYTHDDKAFVSLNPNNNIPGSVGFGTQVINLIPDYLKSTEQDNFSPEVTLTYRPSDTLTAFVSYKRGYKGPGFNLNTLATNWVPPPPPAIPNPATISPFGPEKSKGGEIGVKAQLLDRQVSLSAAAYYYKYDGLQVSFAVLGPTGTVFSTSNAADATTKGLELEATYAPSGTGLRFNSNLAYNDATYDSFVGAQCYGGQNIALGCSSNNSTAGTQDLSGARLARAPRWVAQFGADYERELTDNLDFGLNLNGNYSTGYFGTTENNPVGWQDDWFTFDASVRLAQRKGAWQLQLIGRNLTDKVYGVAGTDAGTRGPGLPADIQWFTNRPREVFLRLTIRPELL